MSEEARDDYHTLQELYEHRHALSVALFGFLGGWKSKRHHDGSSFDGWFIIGADTPDGSVTYHLPAIHWDRTNLRERDCAPEWDGHSSDDVIARLWDVVAH